MREIEFRGKSRITGKWFHGDLVTIAHKRFIDDDIDRERVIPESVGQFTGLTDKNGKKIFEGDIVVIDHTIKTYDWEEIPETYKPRRSHSLSYDEEKDHLTYKRNYAVEWKKKDARWILRNGSDQHNLTDAFSFYHNGIIIGNIHDNPELLKGAENE